MGEGICRGDGEDQEAALEETEDLPIRLPIQAALPESRPQLGQGGEYLCHNLSRRAYLHACHSVNSQTPKKALRLPFNIDKWVTSSV